MYSHFFKIIFMAAVCFTILPQGVFAATGSPVIWSFTPNQAFYDESFEIDLTATNFDTDVSLNPIYIKNGTNNGLLTNSNRYGYDTLGFAVDGWSTSDPTKKVLYLKYHGDQFKTLQPWKNMELCFYGNGGKSNVITIPIIGHVSELAIQPDQDSVPTDQKAKLSVSALNIDKKKVDAAVSLQIESPSGLAKLSDTQVSTGENGTTVTVSDPVQESVTITASYTSGTNRNDYTRNANTTVVFVKPIPKPAPAALSFQDVHDGFWAARPIAVLAEKKIINGFPDGSFQPDQPVTRGQWAALLETAFHLPEDPSTLPFTDVQKGDWDYASINKTSHLLPTQADGLFKPDEPVTRVDAMSSLILSMGNGNTPADPSILQKFSDEGEIGPNVKNHIAIAISRGLISGFPDQTFKPHDSLTRAQASAILFNAVQTDKKETKQRPVLQVGSSGDAVKDLQQLLTNLNYKVGGVDGSFGNVTKSAVMDFQRDHDLATDGVVEVGTWAALDNISP